MKKTRFEIAPQIKQKQVEEIQNIFLNRVLGFEEALITDESYLSDFLRFSKDRALRPGTVQGTFVFKEKVFKRQDLNPFKNSKEYHEALENPENWKEIEFETEPDLSKDEVVEATKVVFKVDIATVYDQPIVDILLYIVENYPTKLTL